MEKDDTGLKPDVVSALQQMHLSLVFSKSSQDTPGIEVACYIKVIMALYIKLQGHS
jgi:hypothetical protein